MPDRLDDQTVTAALRDLPEWTGDAGRISRHVSLGPGGAARLLAGISAAADEMNHHPVVEIDLVVWTHSAGGVTDLDLTLARKIEGLIGK